MAETTGIEWADHTWSPVWGCTQVSKAETGGGGCDNCYAMTLARRFGYGWNGEPMREFGERHWNEPLRWDRRAAATGIRPRVFPSMCDPFDKNWPGGVRLRFFRLIAATPHLTWLLLTKRIGNALPMLREVARQVGGGEKPIDNVWLGATVVNQEEADRDIPKLLAVPARVRFLSIEPMLGPVDLTRIVLHSGPIEIAKNAPPRWQAINTVNLCIDATRPGKKSGRPALNWVIAGGESGPHARPSHPDWFRSLRDQCAGAGVPFFMKQMGGVHDKRGALDALPEDLRVRESPAS